MHRAIIAAVALLVAVPAAADLERQFVVGKASVIDGDTLEIHGKRIRLHGIDAPEGRQTCTKAGKKWRCGQAAANALDAGIESLTVLCEVRDVDPYGRKVATCFETAGGRDLNRWMVWNGWALAYRKYSTAYVQAEEEAREARRGLWAGTFTAPWEWRAQQRDGARSTPPPRRASAPPARTAPKRQCCKVCRKGKPCGDTCISRRYTCHKGPGCAC